MNRADAHFVGLAAGDRETAKNTQGLEAAPLGELAESITTQALLPSENWLALPAVMTPPGIAGRILATASSVVSGRMPSSRSMVTSRVTMAPVALSTHAHDRRHGHDLVVELARGLRGGRAQLAAHAVLVLRLLGDLVALGHRLGGLQHGPVQRRLVLEQSRDRARMCVLASFCTQEMLSRPPATMTDAPSVMMRCAASAMDCSPELQKRLMLKPGSGHGQAGAQARSPARYCRPWCPRRRSSP